MVDKDSLYLLNRFADFYQFDNLHEVAQWQKLVHDDATQFIQLCTELR